MHIEYVFFKQVNHKVQIQMYSEADAVFSVFWPAPWTGRWWFVKIILWLIHTENNIYRGMLMCCVEFLQEFDDFTAIFLSYL